jgi:hypothetical protein
MIVGERDEVISPFPVWARGGQAPLRAQTALPVRYSAPVVKGRRLRLQPGRHRGRVGRSAVPKTTSVRTAVTPPDRSSLSTWLRTHLT